MLGNRTTSIAVLLFLVSFPLKALSADPAAAGATAGKRGDYRLYFEYGWGGLTAPGITCDDPRDLENIDAVAVYSTSDELDQPTPPRSVSQADMVAHNRAVASLPGFTRRSSCRPITHCDERYGRSAVQEREVLLDQQCLSDRRQLAVIAASGKTDDLRQLLRTAPRSWRRVDKLGDDAYDSALIAAARAGRADAIGYILPKIRAKGFAGSAMAERPIERAAVALFVGGATAERLRTLEELLAAGARQVFVRKDKMVSLFSESVRAEEPFRSRLMQMLAAYGGDPDSPLCAPTRAISLGPPALAQASRLTPATVDTLLALGARVQRDLEKCEKGGTASDPHDATSAALAFMLLQPDSYERRQVAAKIIGAGGRLHFPYRARLEPTTDLRAVSIVAAAAQRGGVLKETVDALAADFDRIAEARPALNQLREWEWCAQTQLSILLDDRAEFCVQPVFQP